MKIKAISFLMTIIILILGLSACNDNDHNSIETDSIKTNVEEDSTPQSNEPYELLYTSNNDGTCTVTIKTNPCFNEEFTVSIPEKSPDSDTVTIIGVNNFSYEMDIPHIVSKEVFEKLISDILSNHPELKENYTFDRIRMFYQLMDSSLYGESKGYAETRYPLLKITPFYHLDDMVTPIDVQRIKDFFNEYAPDYTAEFWKDHVNELNTMLKNANIDPGFINGVKQEYPSVFVNYSDNISNIELPSTIVEIKPYAFRNLTIENIALPEGLKTIGNYAFAQTSIKKLTIPKSVTYLGERFAFSNSSSFTEVIFTDSTGWYFESGNTPEWVELSEEGTILGLDNPEFATQICLNNGVLIKK